MNKKITTKFIAYYVEKVMKVAVSTLMICVVVMGIQNANAQQTVVVEPDNFPAEIGALNEAIEQNGGDVIYVLRNGATYFLDSAMEFEHFLHIEAEEYPSDNPPIIRAGTDVQGNSQRISTYQNDIIMRGIFFYGLDDLGGLPQSQRTSGEGIHLHYQYCYFMGGNNYFWWLGAINTTLRIEDSQLANAGRSTSPPNQRFIDTRGNDTDSIIVINSSIYNLNFHILRDGGARINNVIFDHVTVMNHSEAGLNLHLTENVSITNSLFYHTGLDGSWESKELVGDAGPDYDGPRYFGQGGLISITPYDQHFEGVDDAPSDEDRSIVIRNNNFGGLPSQDHLDNWAEFSDPQIPVEGRGSEPWGTDPQWIWANPDITPEHPAWAVRDTIPLVRVWESPMDSTLKAWEEQSAPWSSIENNMREQISVTDMPESTADYVRAVWFGLELMNHYDRWDDISDNSDDFFADGARYFHPGPGTPMDTEGPTAAWFRDLSYNTDSQSFTHGENGYPVGNLNFYPELRERWGDGDVLTSSEDQTEISRDFELVGNYPNPFNPTTNIVFELGSTVDVTMEVFNILGQRVANMEMGTMTAGRHNVTLDASNLTSGVYLVRMQMGTYVQTHKVTLLK